MIAFPPVQVKYYPRISHKGELTAHKLVSLQSCSSASQSFLCTLHARDAAHHLRHTRRHVRPSTAMRRTKRRVTGAPRASSNGAAAVPASKRARLARTRTSGGRGAGAGAGAGGGASAAGGAVDWEYDSSSGSDDDALGGAGSDASGSESSGAESDGDDGSGVAQGTSNETADERKLRCDERCDRCVPATGTRCAVFSPVRLRCVCAGWRYCALAVPRQARQSPAGAHDSCHGWWCRRVIERRWVGRWEQQRQQ